MDDGIVGKSEAISEFDSIFVSFEVVVVESATLTSSILKYFLPIKFLGVLKNLFDKLIKYLPQKSAQSHNHEKGAGSAILQLS